MYAIHECLASCESKDIKEVLIKILDDNENEKISLIPVSLSLLFFRVYVLKNPKDEYMFEKAVYYFDWYSTQTDIHKIRNSLLADTFK